MIPTPRRPASAVVVSSKKLADEKVENMIQAAHEHLMDVSSRSCSPMTRRRRDNQENDQIQVKLADHMDSFPLVPLPVIPQLGIGDLEKVECGLNELLGSLMPHESDQLGRYATRQLNLVQRHLTQQRAQERVFQMLRGDLSVVLAPIGTNTLRKSLSAADVKIGSSRSELASTSSHNQKRGSSKKLLVRPSSNEAANMHWKSKKAVEMARAMVQANATKKTASSSTIFMISAGENGSRKRRRPRASVKRTPEEEARYKAQQLERERENRRQAAYQRLQARRELQAKKQASRRQKKEKESGGTKVSSISDEQKEKDSDSDSEASDVSNCSESDEANEKAILALDVQIESSVDEVEDSPTTDRSDSDGDDAIKDDENNGRNVDEVDAEHPDVPECDFTQSISTDTTDGEVHVPEKSILVLEEQEIHSAPLIHSTTPGEKDVVAVNTDLNLSEIDRSKLTSEGNERNDQDEAIAFNLQNFVTSRAAAKLEQLRAEKQARDNEAAVFEFSTTRQADVSDTSSTNTIVNEECSSVNLSLPRPGHSKDSDNDTSSESHTTTSVFECTDGKQLSGTNDLECAESKTEVLVDEKQPSWIDEVRQSAEEIRANSPQRDEYGDKTLSLPRSPVVECKDYRFYFSNFHCILTSVYEQCRSSSSNSSSSSSLYHRPVGSTGEHTMRLQQKLYESWQSIMQDYATVFGPKIVAPEGMVPVAAAEPWAPHYRINSTARKEVSEIVTQALLRLGGGWEEHPSGLGLKTTWNLLWTWSKPRVERQTLLAWQKVNHFQHAKALTRKDCLKKHIGKYIAAGGRLRQAFDIIPPTFLLPKEYVAFVQAFQERSERLRQSGLSEEKNIWIMKPVALSRGRGISLVNDLTQVIYGEQVVIQEYIAAPRLLDGFKFDLRLYVLVTSFNPLEAFLYDEGFVRLCTRPYEDSDISNIFVHLTNSSIQKNNEDAIVGSENPIASVMKKENSTDLDGESGAAQKDAGGTKTTLAYLWRRLAADGVDVEQVKRSIEEVVLKALLCGEDQIPFQVNSFDLLGYDILLDADLRPWLIEINSSPSMARDNDLDYQVKDAMMLDTLRLVDPLHFDRAKLAEVIARRQRELEDEKRRPHAHTRHPRETEELATRQLNEDLTAILRGKLPRAYGELPEKIGNYQRLCPYTTIYNQLVKLKRSCLRKS